MAHARCLPLTALAASLIALAACATPTPPTAQLNSASGALRAAEEFGAEEYPPATTHLTMARESFAKAQSFIKDERMKEAGLLLSRAKSDAEYALVLARVDHTRTEAQRIARQADELEREAFAEPRTEPAPMRPQPQEEMPELRPRLPQEPPFEEGPEPPEHEEPEE